jgi:hypothetical protein
MRAEDLRIGNYIIYQKEHIIKCDLKDIELSEIDREPIPLTEEILLKCGFVCDGDYYVNGNWLIEFDEENMSEFLIDNTAIVIKHLHQLQNLYFALTGEDLNGKL